MEKLSYLEWMVKYQPKQNHLREGAENNGIVFEITDEEYGFICEQPRQHVWTLICNPQGREYMLAGLWIKDRIGYVVCETPYSLDIVPDDVPLITNDDFTMLQRIWREEAQDEEETAALADELQDIENCSQFYDNDLDFQFED